MLLMALHSATFAYDFMVDGLCYNKNSNGKSVAVTYQNPSSPRYNNISGDLIIPESVTYSGTTYSVTSIGSSAFVFCTGLTSVTIPNSVTSIGSSAFFDCSGLTSVTIGNSVTSIGEHVFEYCSGLSSILVQEGNLKYDSRNNCNAIIETATNALIAGCQNTIIPNSVTSIGDCAFESCDGLTSITIPNSVTSIGDGAFDSCYGLRSVTIPNSVTSIGSEAFCNCYSLYSIVSCIKDPAAVDLGSDVFALIPSSCSLFVPEGTVSTYQSLPQWRDFKNISPIMISSIEIQNLKPEVYVGDSFELDVSVVPEYADKTAISWNSSNPNVASVDQNGKVTAKAIGIATITATATDGSGKSASREVSVTGISKITLNKTKTSVYVGGTEQLQASLTPSDVIIKTLSWKSSNTSVATVDQNGKVTAKAIGTATITATATDGSGKSASCEVSVMGISQITLNKTKTSVYIGGTEQLYASLTPSDVIIKTLSWESSNTSVATVDQTGKVTAKAIGTATITATASDGSGKTASCEVSVTGISKITLNKTKTLVYIGGSEQLQATLTPSDVIIKTLLWKSSDTGIATVDQTGKVYAKAIGTATITATATDGSGKSASCIVNVIGISQISLDKNSMYLQKGGSDYITATITPSNVIIKTLSWTSDNNNVATVDQSGKVTAKGFGTATITAAATDGSGVTAECEVTVGIAEIQLNKATATIYKSGSEQLIATIFPSEASGSTLSWKSSNTSVATVDQTGKVTAKNLGTATITATATDGSGKSASCVVSVVGISKITLNKSAASVYAGGIEQLEAAITPSDVIINTLKWSSSNTYVATVDQTGKVTAKSIGTATITATATDGTGVAASCQVSVIGLSAVTLNKSTTTIYKDDTEQLQASVAPSEAILTTLSWKSSNTNVATVSQSGKVTAVGLGTATITASATDGSGKYATCAVTVKSPYILSSPSISHLRGEDTTYDFPISFTNRKAISALQFIVTIPSALTLATDKYGNYDAWLDGNRKSRSHSVLVEDYSYSSSYKAYKIVISSTSNSNLRELDGVLLHLNLKAQYHSQTGDYPIKYSNIVAAEADETQHYGDNSQSIVSFAYLVGDANADAEVDIADYVCTANYILGRDTGTYFYTDAANAYYSDNAINVTDLVAIVNYALERKEKETRPSRLNAVKAEGAEYVMDAAVKTTSPKSATVALSLNNDRSLAAMQLDLNLPTGVKLSNVVTSERIKGIEAAIGSSPEGKARIILSGFGTGSIVAGCGELLTLSLQGDLHLGDMMSIDDAIMAESDLTVHSVAAPLLIDISQASGIGAPSYDHVEIYVKDGYIIIESPSAGYAQLTRLNGISQTVAVAPGLNRYEISASIGDVIIASFNGVVKKFQF